MKGILAAGVLVLVTTGCAGGGGQTKAAYTDCIKEYDAAMAGSDGLDPGKGADYLTLTDDDHTIVAGRPYGTGAGEIEQTMADIGTSGAAGCVLEHLDAPRSLTAKIDTTTSLMGRQSDNWDGDAGAYEASWSYHPDNGLELFIEES